MTTTFIVTGQFFPFHIEPDGKIWYRPFIEGELSEKKLYVTRPSAIALVLKRAYAQGYKGNTVINLSKRLIRCLLCGLRYDAKVHKCCPSCK